MDHIPSRKARPDDALYGALRRFTSGNAEEEDTFPEEDWQSAKNETLPRRETGGQRRTGAGTGRLHEAWQSPSFKSLKLRLNYNPTSVIYFTMGLLNIFMQLVLSTESLIFAFWPALYNMREILLTCIVLGMTLMYSSFWLTGWLCAYYCVTISNFSHRLIVGLKQFLSSFLPHVLLLSVIGSFFMSILMFWMADMEFPTQFPTNNTSESFVSPKILLSPVYRAMVTVLGCGLPFILALGSTGVTVFSLITHIIRMKNNVSGYTRPNLHAHINATRTMVLLFTFSVIFYIIESLFLISVKGMALSLLIIISYFVIMSFPTAEAIIIIQAIPKLRKIILGRFYPGNDSDNGITDDT
ncbi:taste receptor type 2 member 40-like [Hyperolius riggenbachi]|uniref:taste receptor type 2 member 40-like n=1 Tax=Hyperolius riggenbachi TaxID=752182 RepID=UPI0035A28E17